MAGVVTSVNQSSTHSFSKRPQAIIRLIAGVGVEDDAHAGTTVQHRSRVARDPSQPNLRQVHLIHSELHQELRERGFRVESGDMGENITTSGIDLLGLPTGALLRIGDEVTVEITGLRNPCAQLDTFQSGLMKAVLDRDEHGHLVRKAGVMAIVHVGGTIKTGDAIEVELPDEPHRPLQPV